MDTKEKRADRAWLFAGVILGCLAVLWTVSVRLIDVAPIGPLGTLVGFSRINGPVADALPYRSGWYLLSEGLGICALGVVAAFAVLVLVRLVRCRRLSGIDRELWALGVLYAITAFLYLFFEIAVVNARPVLLEGETTPAASYPSSHTVLAIVVFCSAAVVLRRLVSRGRCRLPLQIALCLLAAVTVLARLLSGVYWLSDMIGGCLFGAALVCLFVGLKDRIFKKTPVTEAEKDTETE